MQKLFKGSKIVGASHPIVIAPMGVVMQEVSSFDTSLGMEAVPISLRKLTTRVCTKHLH